MTSGSYTGTQIPLGAHNPAFQLISQQKFLTVQVYINKASLAFSHAYSRVHQLWLLSRHVAQLSGCSRPSSLHSWNQLPPAAAAHTAVHARAGVEGPRERSLCPGGQEGAGAGPGVSFSRPAKSCPLPQARSTATLIHRSPGPK